MEEEQNISTLRKFGRLMLQHKKKLYAFAAGSMAAYMGYKIYSRSVGSSDFTDSLKEGEISKVIILGLTVIFKKNNSDKWFITERSLYNDEKLLNILETSNAKFSGSPISDTTPIIVLVNIVLPTYLMIWALKKFIMPDTDNPVKPNIVSNYVGFSDIGGNEHAKDQLLEIADYIKNPEKYQKLGIRLPRGILLYGPPGTGKTLMARALSWEGGIPIKYACGSDFVELYAGLGPKRIRSLFETARGLGKCIIFIDELDSLGGERGKGNACKEFDNTLNQLLTEMDGFQDSSGITVIAATNQEENIDEALLRPGRFDRKIKVELPDFDGRGDIFKIHLGRRNINFTIEGVEMLAANTNGFTGAEIENVVNESSFIALKRIKDNNLNEEPRVDYSDIEKGLEKVLQRLPLV